jgi:putative membrane protein
VATTDEHASATDGCLREYAEVYLKGTCMGAADAVPGVSGGTIALIVGIYERLIAAITALDPRALGHLRRVHTREGRRALLADLVEMDVPFLLALGIGVLTSLLLVSGVMHVAATEHPVPTYSFFFGLIAASAIVLRDEVALRDPRCLGAAVVGFFVAFLVAGAPEGVLPHSLPVLFGAGAGAISAMVLPGVSGSFILLLLGQYEFMTGLPERLAEGVAGALGGDASALVEPFSILLTFGAGATLGLFTFAYLVRWALANYRRATLAFLVALMVGALRAPFRRVDDTVGGLTAESTLLVLVPGLVGAGLVLALDHLTDDIEY